jgi:hypothetical protein
MKSIYLIVMLLFVFTSAQAQETEPPATQKYFTAVTNKNDHTPMIMIGNDTLDYWTRAYGLSSPSKLVDLIAAAANRK